MFIQQNSEANIKKDDNRQGLRKPYLKPRLSVLGDLRTLTLGPSKVGISDSPLNSGHRPLLHSSGGLPNVLPSLDVTGSTPTPGSNSPFGNP